VKFCVQPLQTQQAEPKPVSKPESRLESIEPEAQKSDRAQPKPMDNIKNYINISQNKEKIKRKTFSHRTFSTFNYSQNYLN
jgi:hypothetical protein